MAGVRNTRGHNSWRAMHARCKDKKNVGYKNYGARGITVCDRWSLFSNFIADMGKPKLGNSLERIDNNGNYEKSNCKWASSREQNRNRRDNRFIMFGVERIFFFQIPDRFGISSDIFRNRYLRRKWPLRKALGLE